MSINLRGAFNLLSNLQARPMTYSRLGSIIPSATVKLAISNYHRNLAVIEDSVVKGREFVVSRDSMEASGFGVPTRGDRLVDSDMGNMIISEVIELVALGEIIGYRVRIS